MLKSDRSCRRAPARRYQHVFLLDKLAYNTMHPFTSWMPILCWIVVRTPPLFRLLAIVTAHHPLEWSPLTAGDPGAKKPACYLPVPLPEM